MYNDELDYALESAYEDGYYQALADMGYEFDDEASEDVDIFDEDCFDDAMEGNPDNKAKRQAYDRMKSYEYYGKSESDTPLHFARGVAKSGSNWGKNYGRRKVIGAHRERDLDQYGDFIQTRTSNYTGNDYKAARSDAQNKANAMGDAHRWLLIEKKRDTPEKIRQSQIDEAKRYHDFKNRYQNGQKI